MICHQYKCIFIHVPKDAGQSIERVFLNLLDLTWESRAPLLLRYNDRPELGPPSLAHLKANEYVRYCYLSQELFDQYFKFTFVRNPWDRTVSIYKYFGYNTRFEFKFFLTDILKKGLWQERYWFVGPQSDFVCAEDGKILVDFIGRFENLQDDFSHVCQRIGLPPTEVPRLHESSISVPRLSLQPRQFIQYMRYQLKGRYLPTFKGYQDYYDDESSKLVAKLYQKDVELFGYKFDEKPTS